MKIRSIKCLLYIAVFAFALCLFGCERNESREHKSIPTTVTVSVAPTFTPTVFASVTPTPSNTPIPTVFVEELPTPTPTPYGVERMSLYRDDAPKKMRFMMEQYYESEWIAGEEIVSLEAIASDSEAFDYSHEDFLKTWMDKWNRYEHHEECRIGYRLQFDTLDGQSVDVMLKKPGDEKAIRDYVECFLYDDFHQTKGKKSILKPDTYKSSSLLTSLQLIAGKKIAEICYPIRVTAYVYHSDEDFDENGQYIGVLSYSVDLLDNSGQISAKPGYEIQENDNSTTVVCADEIPCSDAGAVSLPIHIWNSNGKKQDYLLDRSYFTRLFYEPGDKILISSETDMSGIYLKFGTPAVTYQVKTADSVKECGENGFLHDYIALDVPTKACLITITGGHTSLCEIYAYSAGELPASVQVWEAPKENVDILIFSTHADDEVLFFGGAATLYAAQGKSVQVVYLSDYFAGEMKSFDTEFLDYGNTGVDVYEIDSIREHEKLDGLWTMGIHTYPVCMGFADRYADSLEYAKKIYDFDEVRAEVIADIRRFKPLIVISHDAKGEYGHGTHMLLHEAVKEAVSYSMSAKVNPDSAEEYGTWDVPKTYIHLYQENSIFLDLRQPLAKLNGKSALEVTAEAYQKHVTQQCWWFFVGDDYEYSCADFGLLRSTVGKDTGNDMFENLISYENGDR